MNIHGKYALVTGGAHRVGRALTLALSEHGAAVCVHYNRSQDEAAATVAEITASGRVATALQADLSDAAQARDLPGRAAAALGGLDIVVNSAASFESEKFEKISIESWNAVLSVNLTAPFLIMQASAALMAEHGGVVINVADLSAFQAWPSYAHHAVSKAGLVHLTRVGARALGPAVRVNAIAPGTVLPPDDYSGQGSDGTSDRRVVAQAGTPEDVARAMMYLIESNFVTGQIVVVDGGRMLL